MRINSELCDMIRSCTKDEVELIFNSKTFNELYTNLKNISSVKHSIKENAV